MRKYVDYKVISTRIVYIFRTCLMIYGLEPPRLQRYDLQLSLVGERVDLLYKKGVIDSPVLWSALYVNIEYILVLISAT